MTFDLLLLGTVLSTRRLFGMLLSILHCQAMLRKNSGIEVPLKAKECVQANTAELNSVGSRLRKKNVYGQHTKEVLTFHTFFFSSFSTPE